MGISKSEIESKIKEHIDAISSDLEDLVKDDRENQPYKVTCQECGEDINYDKTIDLDGDIILEIPYCDCALKKIDNVDTEDKL